MLPVTPGMGWHRYCSMIGHDGSNRGAADVTRVLWCRAQSDHKGEARHFGPLELTGTRPAWLHGGPDLGPYRRLSDEMNSATKRTSGSFKGHARLCSSDLSKCSRRPSILLAPFSLVCHGGPIRTYTSVTTAITRRFSFLRFPLPPTTTSSLACSDLTSNFLLLVCRSYFPFSWFSALFFFFLPQVP